MLLLLLLLLLLLVMIMVIAVVFLVAESNLLATEPFHLFSLSFSSFPSSSHSSFLFLPYFSVTHSARLAGAPSYRGWSVMEHCFRFFFLELPRWHLRSTYVSCSPTLLRTLIFFRRSGSLSFIFSSFVIIFDAQRSLRPKQIT